MGKIDFLTSWAPTKKVPSPVELAQGHSPFLQPKEDSFWKSCPHLLLWAVGDDEENALSKLRERNLGEDGLETKKLSRISKLGSASFREGGEQSLEWDSYNRTFCHK